MKKLRIIVIFLLFKIFFSTYAIASDLDPKIILNNVDDIYRSNASHGILTLAVTTSNWQRSLTLEQWSKGKNSTIQEDNWYIKKPIPKPDNRKGYTGGYQDFCFYLFQVRHLLYL